MPWYAVELDVLSARLPLWTALLLAMLGVLVVASLWQQGRLTRRLARQQPTHDAAAVGLLSGDATVQALDDAVAQCDRTAGVLCLLMINLDQLQAVNDGYGHQQADLLIKEATGRLRALAGPHAVLAHLGGVEFLLLLHADLPSACGLAGQLCQALGRPYAVPGRTDASLSGSVGVVAYPLHGARPKLIGHAALAMRQVQRAGGGDYMVFDPKMAVDLRDQAELLADLRQAVQLGQLELYYQPQVMHRACRSPPPRRCCAGTTPSAAWSARRCLSRWPSATALSAPSATG